MLTPFSWVISYGQVGHLNEAFGLLRDILFMLCFEITWPHLSSIGIELVSFETGHMKMLWKLKSCPISTSQGISLDIVARHIWSEHT
mgnify:CR=1 FL=1